MKKNPEKTGLQYALLIGLVFYPLFFILDLIMYAQFQNLLLTIRLAVVSCFIVLYVLLYLLHERYLYLLMVLSFFSAGFGITLMCFVTKAGFASPYYAGIFLVFISASVFYRIAMRPFVILMGVIILQHFVVLLFIPFEPKDLLMNVFFLGAFVAIALIVHYVLLTLFEENTLLKKLMPICSNCKKIRDDQGYWNQIEQYFTEHSEAQFSHGICPECAKALYGIELKK